MSRNSRRGDLTPPEVAKPTADAPDPKRQIRQRKSGARGQKKTDNHRNGSCPYYKNSESNTDYLLRPSKTRVAVHTNTNTAPIHARTVEEFCHAHRISRANFYNLLRVGQGPVIMKVGKRTLISDESAAAWRRRMEQQHSKAASRKTPARRKSGRIVW